jgi:CRISPR-associated endonuclease/helicase Cas3
MVEFPSFETFFQAVHGGLSPLPWQKRLAAQVASDGWPDEIGVPTGLGKTSCLDIALWGLASHADHPQRLMPTRIWYVVNRRLLVDAAYAHGELLARLIRDPVGLKDHWAGCGTEHVVALERVNHALASVAAIGINGGPLHVVRLRGGAELGARPPEPSQPTMVFATVPMFASRWLFRGYGSSRGMWPIDAALAGTDSLILLDEAHLSAALVALSQPLADCDPGDPTQLLPAVRSTPRLVSLTATGSGGTSFDLDEDDLAHPVVQQRIHAHKPVRLVESSARGMTKDLAEAAISAMEDTERTSCLVFANTPTRARDVATRLRKEPGRRVLLATGQMRDREADHVRHQLLDPVCGIPAGRDRSASGGGPLWVVATQTLEVGADLDADVVVTEGTGVRALIQRLGRCNRLGSSPSPAVVICHAPDLQEPLYGDEPNRVIERLRAAPEPLSLSPALAAEVLGPPGDHDARQPEVLPWLVWEWVKTSSPSANEAPVDAYFAPSDDDTARVSVCWRAYRPDDGVALQAPITASESVDVPIGGKNGVRAFLTERPIADVRRLGSDRASLQTCTIAELRPGDVVVLAPGDGGYDPFGWDAESTAEVLDVSLGAARSLPVCDAVADHLVTDPESRRVLHDAIAGLDALDEIDGADGDRDREFATSWLDVLRSATPHPWLSADEWRSWCGRWRPVLVRPVDGVRSLLADADRRMATLELRADGFEQLSFDATSTALEEHLGSVGEVAGRIAAQLALPPTVVATVELAARLHDLGKADLRFQQWLDPDSRSSVPLAKSGLDRFHIEGARVASGWPRGGRHEAISGRLVQAWIENQHPPDIDAELLIHLVVAHHGHGRPLVPVVDDPAAGPATATVGGISVEADGDLSVPDWGQPARFRALCERYGYWGVALLEAVVRQADQAVSSAVVA